MHGVDRTAKFLAFAHEELLYCIVLYVKSRQNCAKV